MRLPLNLTEREGEALAVALAEMGDDQLDSVRDKLSRLLGPRVPDPIPGQITIDEALEEAA